MIARRGVSSGNHPGVSAVSRQERKSLRQVCIREGSFAPGRRTVVRRGLLDSYRQEKGIGTEQAKKKPPKRVVRLLSRKGVSACTIAAVYPLHLFLIPTKHLDAGSTLSEASS